MPPLTAPFPYFGGKKTVAPIVWSALGNPYYYIEPFCGSAAVLLARPHKPSHEIIGDLDCFLVNFWRAMKHGPDLTASYADHLNSQADMNARHKSMSNTFAEGVSDSTAPEVLLMNGPSYAHGQATFLEETP